MSAHIFKAMAHLFPLKKEYGTHNYPKRMAKKEYMTAVVATNRKVISGSSCGALYIYETNDWTRVRRWAWAHYKSEITALSFSPNEEMLAVGSKNGLVRFLNMVDNKVEFISKDRVKGIKSMRFTPNGTYLLVRSIALHVFNVETKSHVFEHMMHVADMNNQYLIYSIDRYVYIRSVDQSFVLIKEMEFDDAIEDIIIAPSNKIVLFMCYSQTFVYQMETWALLRKHRLIYPFKINACMPNRDICVSATKNHGRIMIWSLRTGRILREYTPYYNVRSLSVSKNGEHVMCCIHGWTIFPDIADPTRKKYLYRLELIDERRYKPFMLLMEQTHLFVRKDGDCSILRRIFSYL